MLLRVFSFTLLSVFCGLISANSNPSVSDAPYYQDISHRGQFKGGNSVAGWESFPFASLESKSPIVHLESNDCFVALSDNTLYFSSRNQQQAKLSLDSPYNPWMAVAGQSVSSAVGLIAAQDSSTSFYLLTANNVVGISLSSGCESISSQKAILHSNLTWGTIQTASISSDYLWIASTTSPTTITQILLSDGSWENLKIKGISTDDAISTLYWVEAWNQLFVGSNSALFTLSMKEGRVMKIQHEWIGGLLDSVVLDMSYDQVNDALWVAEVNSVHKLTKNSIWYRYGQRQGSVTAQITSVAAANGFVYVGSVVGLSRLRGDADPTQYYKGTSSEYGGEDPWSWSYYAGQRYLPDDSISHIVAGSQKGTGSFALAIASTGMALMETDLWTLSEKSQLMESYQNPRHFREGLTTGCRLNVYADLSSYEHECDDNDGLWTAMHAMGEVYRYLATKDESARQAAWAAFEGLEKLSIYPGNYPYFPARSFATVNDSKSGMGGCSGENWIQSTVDPNYVWKKTTSSDEIDGHLAIYPMIYDHIATSESEKKRAYDLIEGITGGILANDLYLIDPATGQPTHWGFWNPTLVNDDPEHYSERGTNSLEILAFFASAYSVTHDNKYKAKFWELAIEYDYIYSALNGKIDNPVEDNHSDNELLFQAYHILLYALQRLSPDDASVAGIRQDVAKMVDVLLPSLHRMWTIVQGELSPLWLGIYAGTGGQRISQSAVSDATWSLRHWAMDLIEWPIHNGNRWDITPSPFYARDSTDPLMRQIIPEQERSMRKWNSDPFELKDSGSGYAEEAPYVFQLPYYLMRYNGLIRDV